MVDSEEYDIHEIGIALLNGQYRWERGKYCYGLWVKNQRVAWVGMVLGSSERRAVLDCAINSSKSFIGPSGQRNTRSAKCWVINQLLQMYFDDNVKRYYAWKEK